MTYGLGYRPDPADHGLPSWNSSPRMHAALRASIPKSASVESFMPPILDQGPVGSCMGHGCASLLWAACLAAGRPLPFVPSPKGIYDVARMAERARKNPKGDLPALHDDGAFPVDAITGLRLVGIRPMGALVTDEQNPGGTRNSDCNLDNVNDPPDLAELTTSAGHLIAGPRRISFSGSTLVAALLASMSAFAPVGVGIVVDSAFMGWNPSKGPLDGAVDRFDPNGGGHWIAVQSVETLANGQRIVTLRNSWGAGWGDAGVIRVTEGWLINACSDPTAFVVEEP